MTCWKCALVVTVLVTCAATLHLTIGDGWGGVVRLLLGVAVSWVLGYLYGTVLEPMERRAGRKPKDEGGPSCRGRRG